MRYLCYCREVYLPPKFGVSQTNYSIPADGTAHLHCPVQVEDNIPLSFPLVSPIIVKLPTYSGYQICARRNGFLFFKLGKQMLLLSLPPPAVYTGDLFHCSKQNLYLHLEQLSGNLLNNQTFFWNKGKVKPKVNKKKVFYK